MLEQVQARINADLWLVHRGRYVSMTFFFWACRPDKQTETTDEL